MHDWESGGEKNQRNMKMRTITCFGDWTSGTFLIIMYLFMYVCIECTYIY